MSGKIRAEVSSDKMETTTEPFVVLAYPGVDPAQLRGAEIVPAILAVILLGFSAITYRVATDARWVAVLPLLMCALLVLATFATRRDAQKRAVITAHDLLGDGKDALLQALHEFQAATAVPVRIVVRDDTPTNLRATRQLFEQCEQERVLDSRGILFILSAKTGGYAIALGPRFANKTPSLTSLQFKSPMLARHQCANALIGCLRALFPEAHRLFPQQEEPSRRAADSLDLPPSSVGVPPSPSAHVEE
jgi:hypothetical protein